MYNLKLTMCLLALYVCVQIITTSIIVHISNFESTLYKKCTYLHDIVQTGFGFQVWIGVSLPVWVLPRFPHCLMLAALSISKQPSTKPCKSPQSLKCAETLLHKNNLAKQELWNNGTLNKITCLQIMLNFSKDGFAKEAANGVKESERLQNVDNSSGNLLGKLYIKICQRLLKGRFTKQGFCFSPIHKDQWFTMSTPKSSTLANYKQRIHYYDLQHQGI